MTNLGLCGIALVWFTDGDSLWIKTCRNVQCDIVCLSKEQYYAFYWLSFANWLKNVKRFD